ncbi:FGGY family of carbohydrate kinase [Amanita rubescens]|nr:FGGY family of carbohydrate kinase [Amanita rubescens]
MTSENFYIGVDVGTGSARASLVRQDGVIVASSTENIITHRDPEDHRIFEQSTTNIWGAISATIKTCLSMGQVPPSSVKGIGFDATCSLAVTDANGEPVIITRGDQLGQYGERNVVLWADHRAEEEAELINGTGSEVLEYVGGTMSLEMECPKILWLKKRMDPALFSRCQFFDLPDFLTYRATSDDMRSSCSLTCKFSYIPNKGWRSDFFQKIGLGEFVERDYEPMGAVGGKVLTAGMPVGRGLCKKAAQELGLVEGTPVGSALIDAYAGWLGTVAARYTNDGRLSDTPAIDESQYRLAVIAGTSTCHIVQSPKGVFVNGVWGPYKDAVFGGWWMNEGGQSSTGQLIEFILTTHPAYPQLVEQSKREDKPIHSVLEDILQRLRTERGVNSNVELTKDVQFYPDFHGNRSPVADSRMRGSIVGLDLDTSVADLARKYALTLESISLQTRHIIEMLNSDSSSHVPTSLTLERQERHKISLIYVSGGQAKNRALMQLLANVCGIPVVLPANSGAAVVLGAAILGRFAKEVSDWRVTHHGADKLSIIERNKILWNIMVEMTTQGTLIKPAVSPRDRKLLDAKYKIFLETIDIQKRWRKEMEEASKVSDMPDI